MIAARNLFERFVPPGALLLAALTFGSYAMGLVRDRTFAHTFGAGPELDAYNAAFVLPELLLDVLVASGLTAPFVPIFVGLAARSRSDAIEFGRTVATAACGLMLAVSIILFVAAPATTALIAPGFSGEQATRYVELFRLMCLTPAMFALSIALGELLVAERRFLWYALAPILYNAGIVGGTVVLAGRLGIAGAAIGTVIGAGLHLGIRVVGILRTDLRLRPMFKVRTAAVREFVRLMLPKMAAHPIEPITFLFFTQLATTLGAGTVSSLSFARNFQSVPVNLIGAAFSIAVFPALSAAAAAGNRAAFTRTLRGNLVTVGALSVVAGIGLAIVSGLAIRILLGGGAFDEASAARTASLLVAFAISVPFDAVAQPLARGLYATRNTTWPVLASVVSLVVIVAATTLLVAPAGVLAIPLGFALGAAAKVVVMAVALPGRIRQLGSAGEIEARTRA